MAEAPTGNRVFFKYYDYDTTTLLFETVGDSGNMSTSEMIRAEVCPTPFIEGREFIQWDLFSINNQSYLNSGVSFKVGQAYPIEIVSNINANEPTIKATARWKVPGDYIILDCGGAPVIKFYVNGNEYIVMEGSTWLNAIQAYPSDFGTFASATQSIKYLKNNRQIVNTAPNNLIIENYNYITDNTATQEPT